MKSFQRVEEFALASRTVKTEAALRVLLENICDDIGFQYFALVHHVDVAKRNEAIILIHNYPDEWVEYFEKNNLFPRDPVHRASHTTSLGFAWSEMAEMIRLTAEDTEVLRRARTVGIGDGFTVPANVPGEANGSCSFATSVHRALQAEQMPMAQLIGAFAFEAARRLSKTRVVPLDERRPLTARQLECVTLVAKGKTDWEISRILGVSHETVIQHLKLARERYGVTKRTTLAVKALFDGSISFAEVLDGHPHFWEWPPS